MQAVLGFILAGMAAFYLTTYAVWAWRKNLRRGAVGIVVVALVSLALPLYLLLKGP